MSLDEFKFIYWMEYAHRMWGRILGVVFAGPFAYFLVRGRIGAPLAKRLALLMAMGGGQGLVGWWMVKSGLEEPTAERQVPRVSPYRLAAHLASAFTIFSLLLWTAMSVARPVALAPATEAARAAMARARGLVHPVAALVGVTALSGAFVAGNDAGHAYNTFPKMGDEWVPEGILEMTPVFRNFFENTATVQFQHRVLALTTLAAVTGFWAKARSLPLPPDVQTGVNILLGLAYTQVTLGIATLLTYVPVSLGTLHQAGAMSLFTAILYVMHGLRRPASSLKAASGVNAVAANLARSVA
eukprot:jgi/Mesvir1/15392/Mv06579-RA.1